MKRRLLIVAPSAYLYGGLAAWLDYLIPGLEARAWEVTLGLVEGPRYHRPDAYVRAHPCRAWVGIPCRSGTPYGRQRALVKAMERVRPDLVLAVNIPDVFPAVARCRQRGWRVASAMALHGIQADLLADLREGTAVPDAVIATNRLACRLAADLGGVEALRVLYAPCGVAVPPLTAAAGGDRLRVAWVGRMENGQKRVGDIPPILERLERARVPFECMLAGDGPDAAVLRRRVQRWEDQGCVRWLGLVEAAALGDSVYRHADALLIPSLWETGPLVAWEAMAAGVPLVASRYIGSGLERALEDGVNALLVHVGDVDGAAEALARVWRDPGLRARLRTGGYDLVVNRYSHAVSVGAWDAALVRVLSLPVRGLATGVLPRVHRSRLDKALGVCVGECVRNWIRRSAPDGGAGGEWPHCYSAAPSNETAFWRAAAGADGLPLPPESSWEGEP